MQELKTILESNNVNVSKNNTNNVKRYNVTGNQVHQIASKLCRKFGDENHKDYSYFCKIAWKIPENIIDNHFEAAQRGRNPVRLFTWLCGQEILKLPQ